MAILLNDEEIRLLLQERKYPPTGYQSLLQLRGKRGHRERDLDVDGASGNRFRLILRQGALNPLDFSVILGYMPRASSRVFRLRRYNGRSHEHTNLLEHSTFYNFHIHTATERYQDFGSKEDSFAEPTDRFSDFEGALQCLFEDCGFETPEEGQASLFE
jgi:hypothetical protein